MEETREPLGEILIKRGLIKSEQLNQALEIQKKEKGLIGEILLKLGFEPHLACDGSEAVSLYEKAREEGEPFAVVIMDLTIPGGMGGREAMEKLLAIDPDITAIVSSGYANDPIMANYGQFGFKGVVPKPFTVPQLSKVLYQVLGRSL